MKRINKKTARILFNKGHEITLTPSNCGPYTSFAARVHYVPDDIEGTFDSTINRFKYYSCNLETGNSIHYYIEEGR